MYTVYYSSTTTCVHIVLSWLFFSIATTWRIPWRKRLKRKGVKKKMIMVEVTNEIIKKHKWGMWVAENTQFYKSTIYTKLKKKEEITCINTSHAKAAEVFAAKFQKLIVSQCYLLQYVFNCILGFFLKMLKKDLHNRKRECNAWSQSHERPCVLIWVVVSKSSPTYHSENP